MSERSPRLAVSKILECIEEILVFTKDYSYETFLEDKKTAYAVLRLLEVIGEASNRIPKEIRDKYSSIEWGRIIRSRNVIIHDYDVIDYSVIWRIITTHLPPLKVTLEKILNDLEP